MPVQFISEPKQVDDAIRESDSKPVIIHYWNPSMGEESPFLTMFHETDEAFEPQVSLYVVDSGFIKPPHSAEELPLTVLYDNGKEKKSAPFNVDLVQSLISQALA
ncbi:uncharacterized protein N7484_010535 [Penicillium longicatenatum]|uniref:uncharacterized protein n=1 Tax=Penicillium longicatenatum TaxID=1561947 RepID=UPI002547437E|nr:uncharacterized protein N7484_010535 [Penicillium longicatenatum]KAJ5630435.1 hypothetical protein N7484_010535 [Penicillium longicatenatum]